jgi:putative SOS response-associated peptidase YedK
VEPAGRCIIPLDCFALPDGEPSKRTRTWFGLWDEPIFGWAGLWRHANCETARFVGAMTAANELVARVGEAMPVILAPQQFKTWLHGDLVELMRIWRAPRASEDLWMEQTQELWNTGEAQMSAFHPFQTSA